MSWTLTIGKWKMGTGVYEGIITRQNGSPIPDGMRGILTFGAQSPYAGTSVYSQWRKGVPTGATDVTFPGGWRWSAKQLTASDVIGNWISGSRIGKECTFADAYADAFAFSRPSVLQPATSPAVNQGQIKTVIEAANPDGVKVAGYVFEDATTLGDVGKEITLSDGPHTLRVECAGYKDEIVHVATGEAGKRAIKIRWADAPVAVSTKPAEVEVTVKNVADGKVVCTKSSDLDGLVSGLSLVPGSYTLVGSKDGYQTGTETITVAAKEGAKVLLALLPSPYRLELTVNAGSQRPVEVTIEKGKPMMLTSGVAKGLDIDAGSSQVTMLFSSEGYDSSSLTLDVKRGGSGKREVTLNQQAHLVQSGAVEEKIRDDVAALGTCATGNAERLVSDLRTHAERVQRAIGSHWELLQKPTVQAELDRHWRTLASRALAAYTSKSAVERDGRFVDVARAAIVRAAQMRKIKTEAVLAAWEKEPNEPGQQPWNLLVPYVAGKSRLGMTLVTGDGQKYRQIAVDASAVIAPALPDQADILIGVTELAGAGVDVVRKDAFIRMCLVPDGSARLRGPTGTEAMQNFSFPFYLGAVEVRWGDIALYLANRDELMRQYPKLTWEEPGQLPKVDALPVDAATPGLAMSFCNWMSIRSGLDPVYVKREEGGWQMRANAAGFRLPTTLEWQYAARYGLDFATAKGNIGWAERHRTFKDFTDKLDDRNLPTSLVYFWRQQPRCQGTADEEQYPLGMLNLCGNVQEICADTSAAGAPLSFQLAGGSAKSMSADAVMPWSLAEYKNTEILRGFRILLPCSYSMHVYSASELVKAPN